MRTLLEDLRAGLRALLKSPGFALVAVLTLALGIGANTAIFSLLDRVLLRPLPYPQPERLAVIWEVNSRESMPRDNLSAPDFLDIQRGATRFESLSGVRLAALNLTGDGDPSRIWAGRVGADFFRVLGVQPMLGRAFSAEEDREGGPAAVILGQGIWKNRFGGDPSIVGRSIQLNGRAVTVVGVMPAGFSLPFRIAQSEVYVPLAFTARELGDRGSHFMGAIGRLKPGATLASADAELQSLAAGLAQAHPDSNAGTSLHAFSLHSEVVRDSRPLLLALMGAVGFILLIACANVANLTLARGVHRQRELAVRAALGADPARLVSQSLIESLLLGLAGAGAGLLLAQWVLRSLAALLGLAGPGLENLGLDAPMLLCALGLALATTLLFGLLPALLASRGPLAGALKNGAKGTTSPLHNRLRALLVAAEIAMATALLVGAGLLVRSLWNLRQVRPGFDSKGLLTATLTLPKAKYPDGPAQKAFVLRLLPRLAQLPGVRAATAIDTPPLGGSTSTSSYIIEGRTAPPGTVYDSLVHHSAPGYFRAMGIPLLRGRDLADTDHDACVISERFARLHWGNADPVGQRISFDSAGGSWLSIVGVAGDVHHEGLAESPEPQTYELLQGGGGEIRNATFSVLLRGPGDPAALLPGLKAAIRELDPDLPLAQVRGLDELLARDQRDSRAASQLFAVFAALALALSAIGIYSVMSFNVGQRRQEIAIRMALGARIAQVLGLVLGQGMRMALAGLAVGLAGALALGRLLSSQLLGVGVGDPATYAAVVLLLGAVALLACLLPALRAARVDPMIALRSE